MNRDESWVELHSRGKKLISGANDGTDDTENGLKNFIIDLKDKLFSEDADQLDEHSVSDLEEFASHFDTDIEHVVADVVEIAKGATELLGKAIKIMFQNINSKSFSSDKPSYTYNSWNKTSKDYDTSFYMEPVKVKQKKKVREKDGPDKGDKTQVEEVVTYETVPTINYEIARHAEAERLRREQELYDAYNQSVAERAEQAREEMEMFQNSQESVMALAPANEPYSTYIPSEPSYEPAQY